MVRDGDEDSVPRGLAFDGPDWVLWELLDRARRYAVVLADSWAGESC